MQQEYKTIEKEIIVCSMEKKSKHLLKNSQFLCDLGKIALLLWDTVSSADKMSRVFKHDSQF